MIHMNSASFSIGEFLLLKSNYKYVFKVIYFASRYDIQSSLKTATRASRLGSEDAISYKITDTTRIAKVCYFFRASPSQKKLTSESK